MQSSILERRAPLSLQGLAEALHLDWKKISPETEFFNPDFKGPVIIECVVDTLGGADVKEKNSTRYINYHSGRLVNGSAAKKLTDFYQINNKDIINTDSLTDRSLKAISVIQTPPVIDSTFGIFTTLTFS